LITFFLKSLLYGLVDILLLSYHMFAPNTR